MIYIFDIDGTLANLEHRLHHIQKLDGTAPDWRGFFADCEKDEPIEDICELFKALELNHQLFCVTGRSDEIEEKTANWLRENGLNPTAVYYRKEGDHREDSVVKGELIDSLFEDWREDITEYGFGGIFEDRQQVVNMYRARGLRVFQVAPGNF